MVLSRLYFLRLLQKKTHIFHDVARDESASVGPAPPPCYEPPFSPRSTRDDYPIKRTKKSQTSYDSISSSCAHKNVYKLPLAYRIATSWSAFLSSSVHLKASIVTRACSDLVVLRPLTSFRLTGVPPIPSVVPTSALAPRASSPCSIPSRRTYLSHRICVDAREW
jgi:hypothetical protein